MLFVEFPTNIFRNKFLPLRLIEIIVTIPESASNEDSSSLDSLFSARIFKSLATMG